MNRRHHPHASMAPGYTMVQMLVAAVVVLIVSGITISNSLTAWRNAQVDEIALQLAGWLEEISRAPEVIGSNCEVMIITGSRSANDVIAQVQPDSCAPESSFRVAARFGSRALSVGATATPILFTPRQAITSTSDLQIRLAIPDQVPVRCVRLSSVLGLIRMGRNDASFSTAADCPPDSFNTI